MKGSLDTPASVFEGVTVHRVLALVESLQNTHLRTESHVKRIFSENAVCYEEVLSFLIRLQIVQKKDGVLTLSEEDLPGKTAEPKSWLLSWLLRTRNKYRSEMFHYLKKYQIEAGEIAYRPLDQDRSRESAVRNFLMEMEAVHQDSEKERYILSSDYVSLYAYAINTRPKVSPNSLVNQMEERETLGLAAEIAIMDFERGRLGPAWVDQIDHVALRNVAAGYDIRSLTLLAEGGSTPRYIEVKAVSPDFYCFHWSKNEVNVAQMFQKSYFLYLLPVKTNVSFDLSSLKIIPDPSQTILKTNSDWIVETDIVRCFRKNIS